MKRILATILFIVFIFSIQAQRNSEYSKIDNLMMLIPDSLTRSTNGIASYIDSNFTTQADKSRAIFIWIAKYLQYDVDNMFAINFYQNTNEIIEKVLKTRKGICMHYAELFNEIANKVGIKSYVISGYTKQNGFVDYIPHGWCAGLIDSVWLMFDPTWGSGYIQNSRFVRQLNNYYFKTKPEQLIKSHMPFDPLWQFLNYPVTNQEFYEGKFSLNKSKQFFNYTDTLNRYEKETDIERLTSASIRIERNGVKNSLVFDRLQNNKREIEYYNNKILVETYNSAVSLSNEGIIMLNRFIDYRNKQFTPLKSDKEIKKMVDTAEILFNSARELLKKVKNPDANVSLSMNQINTSIDEAMLNLNEQKTFLVKYFKTAKKLRKSMFYTYTWMGVPIK
jgi:hypothetical protein